MTWKIIFTCNCSSFLVYLSYTMELGDKLVHLHLKCQESCVEKEDSGVEVVKRWYESTMQLVGCSWWLLWGRVPKATYDVCCVFGPALAELGGGHVGKRWVLLVLRLGLMWRILQNYVFKWRNVVVWISLQSNLFSPSSFSLILSLPNSRHLSVLPAPRE